MDAKDNKVKIVDGRIARLSLLMPSYRARTVQELTTDYSGMEKYRGFSIHPAPL